MLPCDIEYLVKKQQQQELLRKIAHGHLVRMAESDQAVKWQTPGVFLAWLGRQMVQWGSRLQTYGQASPTDGTATVKYV